MSPLKRLFDFYVYGNLHVALASSSLSLITMHYFGVVDCVVPIFIFCATIVSYNFIRLYRRSELNSWFYQWVSTNKKSLWLLTALSTLILILLATKLNSKVLVMLVPLTLLTFFYSVPFLGQLNLRSLPGFKLFLISAIWAAVTVLLPAIQYKIDISNDFVLVFIQRMLFVAAITLPFDIRDLHFDNNSLKTVPQLYGVQKTKKIGLLLLMLFLGLNFLKDSALQFLSIEFVITSLALGFLLRSTSDQNRYYSAFFVEALPILWLLGLLITK